MPNNNDLWNNPFEKSVVEDWKVENFPENYKELVSCFHPPNWIGEIESTEVKPKIVMGGRGSGKSHILRMLSVQAVLNDLRIKKEEKEKLKLEDYKKPYFGAYIKTHLFSPLSTGNITYLSINQLKTLFEHLFNMQVGKVIINAAMFLCDTIEDIPKEKEEIICLKLCEKFNQILKGSTFLDIINSLDAQVTEIQELVRYFPWYNDFSRFKDKIHFTTAPDFIIDLFDIIRREILKDKTLLILLDEYEELDEYQQIFINRLIRSRTLIFRIASKIGGIKTIEYAKDKELDEIHDYKIIPLHFEISKEERRDYKILLENVFINRLKVYGDYKIKNPVKLLPEPTLKDEKLTKEELQRELKEIREGLKKKKDIKDPEQYWKTFKEHYKEAAVYRLLRKKGRDKLYAGFDEYVGLSSGVVRQFILLCHEAFSIANQRGINIEAGEPIPIEIQSKAANKESIELLEIKTGSSEYGSKLVRFIKDLGRILQAKLYYSSEPQANRFEIVDSEKFNIDEYKIPREIIENGLRLPHFLSESSFKPKQPQYSFSFTFSLNWIFAPALKIPPEKRWQTPLRAYELRDICSDNMREEVIEKIIEQIRGKKRITRGKKGRKEQSIIKQRSVLEEPITLTNCPVTDHGCNQNLVKCPLIEAKAKAFLAVPFDVHSWVFDPRRWIKNAMTDQFKIRCVDVDEYPIIKGGQILCKICSCVRQMPIGLFEITELNPNVIFELGMATALNKLNFMLVYEEKIPDEYKSEYPPKPLSGIEYISYEIGENAIIKTIKEKILPTITEAIKHEQNQWCSILRGDCPRKEIRPQPMKILIGLPYDKNPEFFGEVENLLKNIILENMSGKYNVEAFNPAQSLSELCQICQKVRESSFCIVDTTDNDTSMLFALGVAFGKDRKFIQLHNSSFSRERPISDLRNWAIEYGNLEDLKKSIVEELPKRLGEEQ